MPTNTENLVKISSVGLQLLRYLVGYADFCRIVQKGAVVALVIYRITRQILIKFA